MDSLSVGLQGGFGLLGSGISYLFNKSLQDRQNQFNLNMWKLQNEYNSPSAQMERFKEAGLNPNLIYGQGSNGNASSAPVQQVPNLPDIDEHMAKLGNMFNIEGLRKLRAERREAEANADNARTNATRNSYQLRSEESFPNHYAFDMRTGQYVVIPEDPDGVVTVRHPAATWTMDRLSRNYGRNYLIPYRGALIETQKNFLVPQVRMQQYGEKYIPFSYWLDRVSKGASIVTPFLKYY